MEDTDQTDDFHMNDSPPRGSRPSGAEPTELERLVDHRESVPAHEPVEAVYERFCQHQQEFAAVLDGSRLVGLVSRGQLGFLLGGRLGLPLHGGDPICDHMIPAPLIIPRNSSLPTLLDQTFARSGEDFYNDVAVVDAEDHFLGIITVQTLVRTQSRIILEQKQLAEQQRLELARTNQDLFRSVTEERQSKGRYKALFQNSALAVALLNSRGDLEKHNPRCTALLGLTEEASPGCKSLVELVAEEERAAFLDLLRQHETAIDQAAICEREFTLRLPGGQPRLLQFFTSWVAETGQVCAQIRDITEQRAVERKMAQKEKSALFDSLVGGIAHELNNKLSPILGFADLLRFKIEASETNPEMAQYCATIHDSAQEAAKIIRQLLQLSRPSSVEKSRCDLGALASDASTLLRYRLRATGAHFIFEPPRESVFILADGPQIKQVIVNLMINALDALEHAARKELKVSLRLEGPNALLAVSDTGHGIKSEHLSRIFDPFFTTKAPDRGTGLGLSVCLGIVRQHHGELLVRSVPGQGSEFQVLLPQAPVGVQQAPPAMMAVPTTTTASSVTSLGVQERWEIMVVDDEEFITGLVQETLRRRMNCRVERVHHGRHAINRLAQSRFDLVISDVRMPEIDGFALLQWIRDTQPSLAHRTLFITGDMGSADLETEAFTLGVPVLEKPFTADALVEHCQQLLEIRTGGCRQSALATHLPTETGIV